MSFFGCFIKFGKKEHIINFHAKGQMRFGPVDEFAKMEDGNLRGDELENVAELKYFGDSKIYLKPVNAPDSEYKSLDAVNAKMMSRYTEPIGHLFCLYAINADRKSINTTFRIDASVKGFGEYFMIIKDTDEFLRRIRIAMDKQKWKWSYSMVEYVDFTKYNGKKTVFQKDIKYSYQREFRVFIKNKASNPLFLEIGDLSDISVICETRIVDTLEFLLGQNEKQQYAFYTNLQEVKKIIHVL